MARVKKATPADFPRLLEEWKAAFPEGENYLEGRPENALRWLFAMWLEKDAERFLNSVNAPDFNYSHWAAQVFVRMMPEKAAALLFGPKHGELNEEFAGAGATELAELYPALYLKMNPDGTVVLRPGRSDDDWETAIASLAKTDVMAAANACLELDTKKGFASLPDALLSIAKVWHSGHPSMKDWQESITDPKILHVANQARLFAIAETDPQSALLELYSLKLGHDNDDRIDASREIVKRLAETEPVAALTLLKKVESLFVNYKWPPGEDLSAEEQAIRAENPFGHLAPGHYGSGDDVEKNGVRSAILEQVAKDLPRDPARLLSALGKLKSDMGGGSEWQRSIAAGLIREKSETLSAEACLTAAGLWAAELDGKPDDMTFQKLAARALQVNPDLVMKSLEQLPDSARASFAGEILRELPASDVARNTGLLGYLTPAQWDGELGENLGRNAAAYAELIASLPATTTLEARQSFLEKWGDSDPEAAARWVESLPDDAAAKPATLGLVGSWVRYDQDAALSWAASLSNGPIRDAAAARLSVSLAGRHPDEAWQWANSVSDPAALNKAIVELDRRWQYDAPEKYRAALDKARRASGNTDRGSKPPPDPNDPFQ